MKFRSLNGSGDWQFGRGRSSYAIDERAIELNLWTRIKSFKNDCFFDYSSGIDWPARLDKNQKDNLLNDLRTLIMQTEGVMKINSVVVNSDTIKRSIIIQYNIDTVYSQNFARQVALAAGAQGV